MPTKDVAGGSRDRKAAVRLVDVLVIGAGQAGLSAAYHLQHRGFRPATRAGENDERTFVVLDAETRAGGAWQHRWASLKMATVNGIYELPGYPVPAADPESRSRDVLPAYFAEYEQRFELDVQRPVRVLSVQRGTGEFDTRVRVETEGETWAARYVINATGTWTRPHWPHYPGQETFQGRQLHVHDYVSAEEFTGQSVIIVGSGISATQLLEELSLVADTLWVTRTEPKWVERFSQPEILRSLAAAEERVRLGRAPTSIVRVTGMHHTPWTRRAEARGVLVRHPMFTRIEPDGVRMPDGTFERADAILWATGFRAELRHLAPLRLRTPKGGIRVENGRSIDEPRLFVIGYGPSQSTVGANRAGRDAVRAILREESA